MDKVQNNFKQSVTPTSETLNVGHNLHTFLTLDKHVYINRQTIEGFHFWHIIQCSPVKSTDVSEDHIASMFRVFRAVSYMFVSCLVYSSTLKMKVICLSDTSVHFHRTTRLYIAEDRGEGKAVPVPN
jgi:hypothetical protein